MSFIFSSLGVGCIQRRHTDVRVFVRRVVPLEDGDSITILLAVGRKVRFKNLGGDHFAEAVIMNGLLIDGSTL